MYFTAYNVYNFVQSRWLRRPKLAARRAGEGLVAATRENAEGAERFWGAGRPTVLSEVGLPAQSTTENRRRDTGAPLELVLSGQHKPGKGLPLALHALAAVSRDVPWHLHVLGMGECTAKWQRLAESLGLGG